MLHLISQERKNLSIDIKYVKQCLSHNVFKNIYLRSSVMKMQWVKERLLAT